ncbi:MAG: single-stranded DNA-binding protein [Oscillospiraceae bacterium]|nr:single-stranded DNA-binding protein [Oscillospiraceae bacterium]
MLNQVALMGRLTADPELRHTPSEIAVTTFTLAVNRSYVKQGAERQTDFIDIVAWRNTAEFICKYFKKGQMMAVAGSIQTRTYTDKEGKNRKAFEILADNVYFTESRSASAGASAGAPSTYEPRSETPAAADESFSAGSNDDFSVISDDDDLPF